ncbi:basic proline-rich protein-like [Eumetopias jubatus]|uniref:basic proline-rich protein-like n=1 Tax=Eumetopias jubatus TaxID=34886 RepID=UPI0010169AF6|nr:basic proline-rich protein-like [Eumetopias jubatus]
MRRQRRERADTCPLQAPGAGWGGTARGRPRRSPLSAPGEAAAPRVPSCSAYRPAPPKPRRSPGCPWRRLRSLPAGWTPAPGCEPGPTSPGGRAPHAAPRSSRPSRGPAPSRARPLPGAGCVRPAGPDGIGTRGVRPGGVAHAAACRGRRSQGWERTQAPFDPPLELPLSPAPRAEPACLAWEIAMTYRLPPERFPQNGLRRRSR